MAINVTQSRVKNATVETTPKATQHAPQIVIQRINVGCCSARNAANRMQAIQLMAINVISKSQ